MTPRTEIPSEESRTEYSPHEGSLLEDGISDYEVNLLPPPSIGRAWWRTLASSLRDRIAPEKLPPLELTSQPVNLGMLPGDMLSLPWYRTIFTNLGNVITPETLPPLELESQPVDVGELIADRMSHLWLTSLWHSVRDGIRPEKLPPLQLTSQPVDPYVTSEKILRAPHWSSLIDAPKVFLPEEPEVEYARPAVPGAEPAPPRRKPIRVDIDFTHVMVSQLKDDLSRSRLREAFWMSVVAHMTVVILIVMAPKYMPGYKKGVALISAADLMRSKQVTFLELPPDLEKNVPKSNTENLSDKNRIAQSRHPTIDKKTLQQLRDMRRPGSPGAPSAPAQPSPAMPAQPQQMAESQPSPSPAGGGAPALTNPQQSQIQLPQARKSGPSPFQQPLSAGAAIQQATKEAAAARGSVGGGSGGDYGLGAGPHGGIASNLEILSDTQGVDFGPYLSRIVHVVRINWYNLIPEVARAPLLKKGKVSIQFAIMPNGSVAGMQLVDPSGDVSLDRAAWGGITASNPFEPLPQQFHGPYLALRFNFYYNPNKGDLLQ